MSQHTFEDATANHATTGHSKHRRTLITSNQLSEQKNGALPTPKKCANHCLLYTYCKQQDFLLPQTPLREKIDDAANKDTKISTLQALFFKYEEKF